VNVKDQIVRENGYKTLTRIKEDVSEVAYRPVACQQTYRLIIVRQTIKVEEGQLRLHDEVRYRFYLTNDCEPTPRALVFKANDRCDQENLIAQLKGGVHALRAAVDNLVSNWAYMVMTALAWNLKAWFALSVPEHPRHKEVHRAQKRCLLRMEFKRFVNTMILMPCQIVRGGHRLLYRLLSWNEWQGRSCEWFIPCGADAQRERSRDLDVPVHDGIVSQEQKWGNDAAVEPVGPRRRSAFPVIVRAEPAAILKRRGSWTSLV